MKRGQRKIGNYHWPNAQVDLAMGVHPEVVAIRMGVHVDSVMYTAFMQGWPVSWKGPLPDEIIDSSIRAMRGLAR